MESENDDGECYFYRNVFAKIKTPKSTETAARRAKRLSSQILDKNEMDGLLDFIKNGYEKGLSPRQLSRFDRDRLRDIAIISLFQGSGIRVNELVGLQTTDIDSIKGDINVLRKGSKKDTVSITHSALDDLLSYLKEREKRYKPEHRGSGSAIRCRIKGERLHGYQKNVH